jgi:hypothetical protein
MSADINASLAELIEFLKNYDIEAISKNKEFKGLLKSVYRRYHALLIWHSSIEKGNIWKGDLEKEKIFRLYYTETISDLCQSLFLFCQGIYKASYFALRSAIENFIKCIGLAEGQEILTLTSVFELIGLVKETKAIKDSPSAKLQYEKIRNSYARLCKFVHTSDASHMSMTSIVGKFPNFSKDEAIRYEVIFRSIATSFCCILCTLLHARFKKMHHNHFDLVCDILPRSVKKEIAAAH